MNFSRRFSLPGHGAVELLSGIAMMLAPAILGFGAAGLVVSVVLGAIQAGMGLMLTSRHSSTVDWHSQFDSVFVLATALAALGLAAAGEARAAIFLAVLVGVQACVNFTTSYAATA